MKNLSDLLTEKFTHAIIQAFPSLEEDLTQVEITQSTNEKFGHYQCNSAMKLAKPLKSNPRAIAEKVVASFDPSTELSIPLTTKLEIAGPGFINITIAPDFLSQAVEKMYREEKLGITLPKQERVVIDFSAPNVAKEMHVGHLRSTIIGDALARLFEFLGHDVLRLNHIGDWGTQFGMLIAFIQEEIPKVPSGEEETDLPQLMTWYQASKKKFDSDDDFKKRAQQEVVKLQSGDPSSLKAWEIICEISRIGYEEIYKILDVKIEERGESFYNPMLPALIEELEEKKLIKLSDGAKCLFIEGYTNRDGNPLPYMVQKSDGGYNYDTTDLAALKHRCEEEKADRIIYIHDMGQRQHFEMAFRAAEMAGYYSPDEVSMEYVPFGLVLGPDGKKFKTRSGKTEKLIDLLTAAVDKAREIIEEREPNMPEAEKEEIAKALGIGAVKYSDLSCMRTGDYHFSYDKMLRFDGNTAAFLLYSYVRIAGIKRKVSADIEKIKETTHISLQHPSEIALGVHLRQFAETLTIMKRDLTPNRLTDYLYELAQKFNAFFRDCRVEGSDEQNQRLLLCEIVAQVMQQGLEILGLKTVERM